MTRFFKQSLAAVVYRSGLLRRRRPDLVVMYHRVLDTSEGRDHSQPGMVVSTTTFARQLDFLRRHFDVVPLATLVPAGDRSPPPATGRGRCAVTFDDGWADNRTRALPVLRRLGVPATVFVTSGVIGTRRLFWPERLLYIMSVPERTRIADRALDGVPPRVVRVVLEVARAPDAELEGALDRLIETLKTLDTRDRETLLDTLAGATGRDPGGIEPRMLDWDGVRELRDAGIEIGAHGVTHEILTRIDPTRAADEIRESRTQIAAAIGEPPRSFAYPNGDWNPALARVTEETGYERAMAADPGAAIHTARSRVVDRFAVPRKNLSEGSSRGWRGYSESIFACEVLGFFDRLRVWGRRS